jgi:hypothetical protein
MIRGNGQGTCLLLIDGVIPGARHVMKKEAKNILKYQGIAV